MSKLTKFPAGVESCARRAEQTSAWVSCGGERRYGRGPLLEITDLLDKTHKHGPKKLGMAFRGNLHKISDADYQQIERLLKERVPVS